MGATEVSWDDYRFFGEVARAGSIRAAARTLGVDHATVSRRLASLESALSVKLLVRGADGVKLTEAGEELQRTATVVHRELLSVERRITGADTPLCGRIRVSTHAVLGASILMPGIAEFCSAHPQIDVALDLSTQVVSLSMNQADVAVRVTAEPPDDTIARRISGLSYAVYAARAYLATHDPHASPDNCRWIGWDPDGPYPTALKDMNFLGVPVHGEFATIAAQLQAAAHGMGLAALPCFMADADDRLQRLTEPHEATAVYVLRHPDHRSTPRVRVFYEHIRQVLQDHAAALEGRRG